MFDCFKEKIKEYQNKINVFLLIGTVFTAVVARTIDNITLTGKYLSTSRVQIFH